jgi:hypothetical protein
MVPARPDVELLMAVPSVATADRIHTPLAPAEKRDRLRPATTELRALQIARVSCPYAICLLD